jgi:hypothetical protein
VVIALHRCLDDIAHFCQTADHFSTLLVYIARYLPDKNWLVLGRQPPSPHQVNFDK